MKILKVRFANLNSLYGEWELDLTVPALASSGLFVISGPTGSGKTTLLDAISLALYGQTARQGDLSKEKNELMSRRAKDCFSEVTFEAKGTRYRCRWSQRRTQKRKAAGEGLTPIERMLIDEATGTILAEKSRETAARIEELTGLSFDQFCGTVLLAQGQFAAFLNARPDERSAILEQITRTERFGELSQFIHARHREEEKARDLLVVQLSGSTPMSDETRERHEAASIELMARVEAQGSARDEVLAKLQWLAAMERLAHEEATLKTALDERLAASRAFEPRQLELESAAKARQLRPVRQELGELEEAQRLDDNRWARSLDDRQACAGEAEAIVYLLNDAERTLAQSRAIAEHLRPDIDRAIQLDERIDQQRQAIAQLDARRAAQDERLQREQREREAARAALSEKRTSLQKVRDYLTEHASDEGLVTRFAALEQRFEALRDKARTCQVQQDALDRAQRELARQSAARQKAEVDVGHTAAAVEAAKAEVEALCKQLDECLAGRTLDQCVEQRDSLREQRVMAERVEALRAEQLLLEAAALERHARLQAARAARGTRQSELAQLHLHHALDALRTELTDGAPCPLCGSHDHPRPLTEARAPATETASIAEALQALGAEIEALVAQDAIHGARQRALIDELTALSARRGPAPDVEALAALDQLVASVPKLEQRRTAQRDRLRELELQHERALSSARELTAELKALSGQLDERTALLQGAQAEFETLFASIDGELRALGADLPREETARQAILGALRKRRDHWSLAIQKVQERERDALLLDSELKGREARLSELQQAFDELTHALDDQRAQLDAKLRERQSLLGGRPPAEMSAALERAIRDADEHLQNARQKRDLVRLNQERVAHLLEEITRRRDERARQIESATRRLSEQLEALGFESEAACQAAELDDERFAALLEARDALRSALNDAQVRHASKVREREAEADKALTDAPLEALEHRREDLDRSIEAAQREIGGIRSLLEQDAKIRRQNAELTERLRRQELERARWASLNALIGSHDGKSFRNFAQGLTLDALIALANAPLATLTNRYSLCRARRAEDFEAEPTLELAVIDRDQGDALRSVSNLSGGESFLLSLALALGLSRMTGDRARIDSLFLDEGFGTLDEDALAMVLGALGNLRSQGKTIGIISHVPQLREFEPRIEVEKGRAGRSRLRGPGCREVLPIVSVDRDHSTGTAATSTSKATPKRRKRSKATDVVEATLLDRLSGKSGNLADENQ
ncbi:MAG: AAA family ATPase [Myxococcales bacterium]|jgi:exonuclease SbcC|nr:AAA family ATPase [Myxococcales bacterium]